MHSRFQVRSPNSEKPLLASSCMSVLTHVTTGLSRDRFSWNIVSEYFSKICNKTSSIQICQEKRVIYIKTNIHLLWNLVQFFSEWEMLRTTVAEKIRTHILCSITFFPKIVHLWCNVEQFLSPEEASRIYDISVFGKRLSRKSDNVVFSIPFPHRSTTAVQTNLVTPVVIRTWTISSIICSVLQVATDKGRDGSDQKTRKKT
jgi:hypothetical protein